MSDLEVRQLRYFVAVAEELHFGRAAARLGMAQPPLSRAIRELERQLGVKLLERTTRSVLLTPAGEALLRDARAVLESVGAAGRRARHAGQPKPRLRLALKADADGGMLSAILAMYQQEDAALPVELVWGGRDEQSQALRDGRADVALLLSPFDERGLDAEPLRTEPRLAVLAADDPLAARTSLVLADLSGRLLPDGSPAVPGETPPAFTERQVRAEERGLVAEPRPPVSDLTQVFRLVELGCVVCLLPAWVTRAYPRAELAYIPVVDVPPAVLSVGWPRDARSPATAAFVRAAQAAFESVAAPPSAEPAPTLRHP
ncbi:LysR family transcriptional regulator [Actinomadura oligospora]|uniref:LysR family transcriptional regulator n=1 Tax=Actinomadura oligospora TaxID=111804 RepID=UPI00047A76E6|nr:LysR substrate-binding domain-containing protein [Actinomadura oligospora]